MLRIFKDSYIMAAICYIILGAILFLYPALALNLVCIGIGTVVLIFGIMRMFQYFGANREGFARQVDLIIGIILSVLGIFIVMRPGVVASILPFVVGIYIFFDSILNVQQALDLKKVQFAHWWSMLVLALIMVVIGIVMICNPFKTAALTVRVVGAVFFLRGIANIITVWFTNKQLNAYANRTNQKDKIIDGEARDLDDKM